MHLSHDNVRGANDRSEAGDGALSHLRILIVEDDFGDYDAVVRALRRMSNYSSEHVRARTIVEARQALVASDFNVALIDFHLGSDSGVQLLDELGGRASSVLPVLLTGHTSDNVHTAAIRAGAVSCIYKGDLSSTSLETTFRYAFHTQNLEQQMHALVAQLCASNRPALDA